MSVAPLIGAGLGLATATVGLVLRVLGAPALVVGAAVVGAAALLTRGLHLDGLADTADGLGSYADRARALEIMRRPDIGPFGVVTLVVVLIGQAAAAGAVLARPWPAAAAGVMTAFAGGRLAVTLGCRRGVPPARPEGLGALVAGTVPTAVCVLGTLGVAALALAAVPSRPWQGPVAVAAALLAALALLSHVRRRLGGITGDVLGALNEVAATVIYIVVSIS